MLLTIHDANLQKVAFIDNDKQGTLNYYNDVWTRSLETGSSTFEFTVVKKAIQSDTASHKTYNLLNERAFVSFKYKGRSYVFNVMTVEEDEQTIKCYCENLNLELINEYVSPYKATRAMSFVEYCNVFGILQFAHLSVGINEISDQRRTLEWEGSDTKLARLLSLANKFNAEIDFDTQLNADSTIKSFKVNVYHENDDTHQGVGRVRSDIHLTYGKNLKSIKRKIDKTGIYTMIRPTGKGKTKGADGKETETVVTIAKLPAWSENNADGVREFYQSGEALYAPLAAQMYPSTFTTGTQADQWIRKDLEVDSDNPTVIRAAGIANLRKNAYPAISYEVDGFLDVEIGDTVRMYDDDFNPLLLVRARVSEQKISFSNPTSNKTTVANFKALENNLSAGIQSALDRLVEASKPYLIKLSTDNGTIFKNQSGQTIVSPTLYKGGKAITNDVSWHWSLDGTTTTGPTYTVKGSSVANTVTLIVAAYVGSDEVATDELTLVNVADGQSGADGVGVEATKVTYAKTKDPALTPSSWSADVPSVEKGTYLWTKTEWSYTDGKTESAYQKTYVGNDGVNGKDGAQGIPGKPGADGRTPYFHRAWANSADGRDSFSTSDSTNKRYLGTLTDFNEADSQDPNQYKWTALFDNVQVGVRNYAEDYDFSRGLWEYSQGDRSSKTTDFTNGIYTLTTTSNTWHQLQIFSESGSRLGGKADSTALLEPKVGETYTLSVEVKVNSGDKNFWVEIRDNGLSNYNKLVTHIGGSSKNITATNEWKRYSFTGIWKPNSDFGHRRIILGYSGIGSISFRKVELTQSNVFMDAGEALEDKDARINSKADNQLTQAQLNALSEQAGILQSQLEATATIDMLTEWQKAYESLIKAESGAKAQAEEALKSISERIPDIESLGEKAKKWEFGANYLRAAKNGLEIGEDGSSSSILIQKDRISMFSAGQEVMSISQGVLRIDNGVFALSMQIGRFRESQHDSNPDINVIRYVGGV